MSQSIAESSMQDRMKHTNHHLLNIMRPEKSTSTIVQHDHVEIWKADRSVYRDLVIINVIFSYALSRLYTDVDVVSIIDGTYANYWTSSF